MRPKQLGLALTLLAMIAAVYLPVLAAGFVWDDDDYVTENPTLVSADGLRRIWLEPTSLPQYYPLVHTTYWLEYRLWQLSPLGYHVTNVLLHAAGALLLWRVLVLLEIPGAWLAAAIFAVHPVQVESVAWITERKNVLSGMLYLGALLAYLRFALAHTGQRRYPLYALSFALFVLALLSKTVTASLPAAVLVVLWWKRGRLEPGDILRLAPFFVIGVLLAAVTVWLEKVHVGATGLGFHLSFVERALVAGRALWFYAGKIIWPTHLAFIYPRWQIDAHAPWQYVYPAAAVAVVGALWAWRHKIGRGPLAAVLFFAGTLFPALGFFDVYPMVYSFVADHFQYLAGIGLIVLAAATATTLARRFAVADSTVAYGVVALVLATLGFQTWRQCHAYENGETLWRDTLRKDPRSWMAHTQLGAIHEARAERGEAIAHYRRAVEINPSFGIAQLNLGLALRQQGDLAGAIRHLQKGLALRPDATKAYPDLAHALVQSGEAEEARVWMQSAVDLHPADPQLRAALAGILVRQGALEDATLHLQEALARDPSHALALYYSAEVLARQGQLDAAADRFKKVARTSPDLAAEARRALARIRAARLPSATPASGAGTEPP